ncbi:membrane-associated protein, putative [Bodo saltans]|uniref:Membrane-associated protein, putative n=1 Tax=Bodo saltans TaxID=75058 RepID=A0A0S4JKQ0_BODSA|nr:membrane-associated protein, putative [Bodo saltans]|eukprot:CUG92089.1 membrane-associated protein, putative [Bodo saltans]
MTASVVTLCAWSLIIVIASSLEPSLASEISSNGGTPLLVIPAEFHVPLLALPAAAVTQTWNISILPPVAGSSFTNVAFDDVHWKTLFLGDAELLVNIVSASEVEFGVAGVAITTQPTKFDISQQVLGVTISCSGLLAVSIPRAAVMVTVNTDGNDVSVAISLGGISTALTFSSGICSIASSLSPKLTDAVQNAINNALTSEAILDAVNSKLSAALKNVTNMFFMEATGDKAISMLVSLLNETVGWSVNQEIVSMIEHIFVDAVDGNFSGVFVELSNSLAMFSNITEVNVGLAWFLGAHNASIDALLQVASHFGWDALLTNNLEHVLTILQSTVPGLNFSDSMHYIQNMTLAAESLEKLTWTIQADVTSWWNATGVNITESLSLENLLSTLQTGSENIYSALQATLPDLFSGLERLLPGLNFSNSQANFLDGNATVMTVETISTLAHNIDVVGAIERDVGAWWNATNMELEDLLSTDMLLQFVVSAGWDLMVADELQNVFVMLEVYLPGLNFSDSQAYIQNMTLTLPSLEGFAHVVQQDVMLWWDMVGMSAASLTPDALLQLFVDMGYATTLSDNIRGLFMYLENIVPGLDFSESRTFLLSMNLTTESVEGLALAVQHDIVAWTTAYMGNLPPLVQVVLSVITGRLTISALTQDLISQLPLAFTNLTELLTTIMDKFGLGQEFSGPLQMFSCVLNTLGSGPYRLGLSSVSYIVERGLIHIALLVARDKTLDVLLNPIVLLDPYAELLELTMQYPRNDVVAVSLILPAIVYFQLGNFHSPAFELVRLSMPFVSLRITSNGTAVSSGLVLEIPQPLTVTTKYMLNVTMAILPCFDETSPAPTALPPMTQTPGTTTAPSKAPTPAPSMSTTRAPTPAPTTPAPKPVCPFVCPDGSCATSLVNCSCTLNLAVSNFSAAFVGVSSAWVVDPRLGLTASGSAIYETTNASSPCKLFAFTPLLMFRWELFAANGTMVFSVNSSKMTVAASILNAGAVYSLLLTASGIHASQVAWRSWTFTVDAPLPIVSITRTAGTSARLSSMASLTIPTFIVDVVNDIDASPFSWQCTPLSSNGTCPAFVNQSVRSVTIAADSSVTPGMYNITFLYRSVYESSLLLTMFNGAAPSVRIVMGSSAVISHADVPFFAANSILSLAASVTGFSNATNTTWFVNGVQQNVSSKSISLNTTTLWPTPAASLASLAAVANTIRVVVAAADNAEVFGEASVVLGVLPSTPLTTFNISVVGNSTATSAQALTDTLSLTLGGGLNNLPASVLSTFAFFVYDNMRWSPLETIALSGMMFSATAPSLASFATNSRVTATFSAVQRVNGVTVASTTAMFSITRTSNLAQAIGNQVSLAGTVTDPASATQIANNLGSMMSATSNVTALQEMASAVGQLLVGALQNGGAQTLTNDQQGSLLSAMSVAMSSITAGSGKTTLQTSVTSVLTSVLNSGTFDPSNGQTALSAIASLTNATSVAKLAGSLARVVASDSTQPIGEPRVLQVGSLVIAVVRQVASSLANLSISSTSGATMVLPSTITLPGVDDDAVIGVSSTSLPSTTYGSDTSGTTPTSAVASFVLTSGISSVVSVKNLSIPISFTIKLTSASSGATCKYWDEVGLFWSTTGVTAVGVSATTLTCQTTHLTSFASFSSRGFGSESKVIGAVVGGVLGAVLVVMICIAVVKCRFRRPINDNNTTPGDEMAAHPIKASKLDFQATPTSQQLSRGYDTQKV